MVDLSEFDRAFPVVTPAKAHYLLNDSPHDTYVRMEALPTQEPLLQCYSNESTAMDRPSLMVCQADTQQDFSDSGHTPESECHVQQSIIKNDSDQKI